MRRPRTVAATRAITARLAFVRAFAFVLATASLFASLAVARGAHGAVRVRTQPAAVRGALDRPTVMRFARGHLAGITACWSRTARGLRRAGGRLMLSIIVAPDGHVRATTVIAQSGSTGTVARCVLDAVRRWHFPRPPRRRGQTIVTLPVVLERPR